MGINCVVMSCRSEEMFQITNETNMWHKVGTMVLQHRDFMSYKYKKTNEIQKVQ